MASQRLSPESARTVHFVYDAAGNQIGSGHANKSAASAWINRQAKQGVNVEGWRAEPRRAE
jgi:hypothetical protein